MAGGRHGRRLHTSRQNLNHISKDATTAVAEFVAAAKEDLAAGGSKEFRQPGIHRDPEVAARMTAVRHLVLLQNGTEWNTSLKHEMLRFFRQKVEMNADGSKLDGFAIAAPVQHACTDEVVANPGTGGHVEINLTTMEVPQVRCHVAIMNQQMPLLLSHGFRLDKGHARTRAADAIKENERSQNVLVLPGCLIHRLGHFNHV